MIFGLSSIPRILPLVNCPGLGRFIKSEILRYHTSSRQLPNLYPKTQHSYSLPSAPNTFVFFFGNGVGRLRLVGLKTNHVAMSLPPNPRNSTNTWYPEGISKNHWTSADKQTHRKSRDYYIFRPLILVTPLVQCRGASPQLLSHRERP